MQCSKELTRLHLEESQFKGYGSGCSPAFYEAVERHRLNEQSFRFTSSEQLATIEEERVRLEKERRIMDVDEVYFYDYHQLRVLHDFDKRHNLHETPSKSSKALRTSHIKDGDVEEERPPTFRAEDERRKAQFSGTETPF